MVNQLLSGCLENLVSASVNSCWNPKVVGGLKETPICDRIVKRQRNTLLKLSSDHFNVFTLDVKTYKVLNKVKGFE